MKITPLKDKLLSIGFRMGEILSNGQGTTVELKNAISRSTWLIPMTSLSPRVYMRVSPFAKIIGCD